MGEIKIVIKDDGLERQKDDMFRGNYTSEYIRKATRFEEALYARGARNLNDVEITPQHYFSLSIFITAKGEEDYHKNYTKIRDFLGGLIPLPLDSSSGYKRYIGIKSIKGKLTRKDVDAFDTDSIFIADLEALEKYVLNNWVNVFKFKPDSFSVKINNEATFKKFNSLLIREGIQPTQTINIGMYYGVMNKKAVRRTYPFGYRCNSLKHLEDKFLEVSIDKVFGEGKINTESAFITSLSGGDTNIPSGDAVAISNTVSIIPTGDVLTFDTSGSGGSWINPSVTQEYVNEQIEKSKNKLISNKTIRNGKYLRKTSKVRSSIKSTGQQSGKGLHFHQRAERTSSKIRLTGNSQTISLRKATITRANVSGNIIRTKHI